MIYTFLLGLFAGIFLGFFISEWLFSKQISNLEKFKTEDIIDAIRRTES